VESDPPSSRRIRPSYCVSGRTSLVAWAVLCALCGVVPAARAGVCPPRGVAPDPAAARRCAVIDAGVEANLDGRFSDAEAQWRTLRELDPTDPAAPLWEVETAWWRLINDEGATENDAIIRRAAREAIRLADARLEDSPGDPVLLGYQGQAWIQLARLDGIRGSYLKAGRQGERGRELLERALAERPDLEASRYLLGLYLYYADVMPRFLKWVSWLWFVPDGDRAAGLAALGTVASGGGHHSVDARFILMNIRTYHAPVDLVAALETGRALHARYPENALFHSELVEVLILLGLYDEAIATARALEDSHPVEPEAQSRPQLARVLRAQALLLSGKDEEAARLLAPMRESETRLPIWGGAWLHLVRGQIHDARGERDAAVEEYRLVLDREGPRYNRRAALIAEQALDTPFEPSAYRELPMISAGPE
jgi:tetratricopeptide (TPR) repeat protein